MTQASAIVFDAPSTLSVKTLELKPFAPAFMREATLRIAAQSKKHDLLAVTALVERGALSLEGLITHTFDPGRAREAYEVAFGDPQCLKMMINWQA